MPISKRRQKEIAAIRYSAIDRSEIPELGPEFWGNANIYTSAGAAGQDLVEALAGSALVAHGQPILPELAVQEDAFLNHQKGIRRAREVEQVS